MAAGDSKKARLGGFEILGTLGKGGMGTVLKARQVSMDRLVALKILPKKLAENEAFVQRFLREARSAAKLRHPNIVQAFDVGQAEGHYFFAMEFVDGETLEAVVRREGPLDPNRALDAMKQVCSALAAAHKEGIVHRDIKPSNIMLDKEGQVRVTDFGLAKRMEGDIAVTADGAVLGTPAYLAPEMAQGLEVDARSDLYSLGATIFCALAGSPPFDGRNFSEVVIKKATQPAPSLASVAPRVDRRLCFIIDRLLRKEPEARYASAKTLLDDLEGLGKLQSVAAAARAEGRAMIAGAPTATLTDGRRLARQAIAERLAEDQRRSRLRKLIIAGGVAALVLVFLLVSALGRRGTPREQANAAPPTPKVPPKPAPPAAPSPKKAVVKPTTSVAPPPAPKVPDEPFPPPPPPEPRPPEPKGEWVSLFDGKSLSGWTPLREGEFQNGRVRAENGLLVVEGGQPVAGVVCSRSLPQVDYELAFEAKYDGATAVFCQVVFPIGDATCMLDVGGYSAMRVGLEYFDGLPPDGRGSPADKVMKFEDGRWYSVRLRATQANLAYWVDEQKLFETALAGHKFGIAPRWNPLKPLGMLTGQTKLSLRNIRLCWLAGRPEGEPRPEAPAAGQWVSLFDGKALDGWTAVEEGWFVGHGEVAARDGAIELGAGENHTGIRWGREFPKANYEVAFEVKRVSGGSSFGGVVFPLGNNYTLFCMGGWNPPVTGVDVVDGHIGPNASSRRMQLESGRWYKARLRVTSERLKGWVDAEKVIDLSLKEHEVSMTAPWHCLKPFGLLVGTKTSCSFRNVMLRQFAEGAEGREDEPVPMGEPVEIAKVPAGELGPMVTKPFEPFEEDFEASTADRWRAKAGRWHVRQGEAIGMNLGNAWLAIADRAFDDFVLEADVTNTGQWPSLYYGVVFRKIGRGELLFGLSLKNNNLTLMPVGFYDPDPKGSVPGVTTRIIKQVAPQAGRRYRLKVECVGTRVQCFVDGELVAEAEDKTLLSGEVMLHGYHALVRFDNVSVRPVGPRPADAPEALARLWEQRAEWVDGHDRITPDDKLRAWSEFLERWPKAAPERTARARERQAHWQKVAGETIGAFTERSKALQPVFWGDVRELADGRLRVHYSGYWEKELSDWDILAGGVRVNPWGLFQFFNTYERPPVTAIAWNFRHGEDVTVSFRGMNPQPWGCTLFGMPGEPVGSGIVLAVGTDEDRSTALGPAGGAPWYRSQERPVGHMRTHEIEVLKGELVYRYEKQEVVRQKIDISRFAGRNFILWAKPPFTKGRNPFFRDISIASRPQDDWVRPFSPEGPAQQARDVPERGGGWLGAAWGPAASGSRFFRGSSGVGRGRMAILSAPLRLERAHLKVLAGEVRDFLLSLRCELVEKGSAPVAGSIIVTFRSTPVAVHALKLSRYEVSLTAKESLPAEEKEATERRTLASAQGFQLPTGPFLLTVLAQGKRLEVYCNGQRVFLHDGLPESEGAIFIGVESTAMIIHDAKVRPLPTDPNYKKLYGGKAP